MKKSNIIILCISILLTIFASYFIFKRGITKKLIANVNEVMSINKEGKLSSDLPIISMVLNSSGEKVVNTDVAITVSATSNYNIKRLEYSYDLKTWKSLNKNFNSKNINSKLVFTKTMNKDLYIRVVNEKGYKSYAYKTKVNIDKQKPSLTLEKDNDSVKVKASDNDKIDFIQYSKDSINWESEEVFANSIFIVKDAKELVYVRAVDIAGNISDLKKID